MTTLLGKEAGHPEEGLEQALLTLNPLPLHAVEFVASDIAKTTPLLLPTKEVKDAEEACYEPIISEQVKRNLDGILKIVQVKAIVFIEKKFQKKNRIYFQT